MTEEKLQQRVAEAARAGRLMDELAPYVTAVNEDLIKALDSTSTPEDAWLVRCERSSLKAVMNKLKTAIDNGKVAQHDLSKPVLYG